jgi:hypothetical protein
MRSPSGLWKDPAGWRTLRLLAIVAAVDLNNRLISKPHDANNRRILPVCSQNSVAIRCDTGMQSFQCDIERKAAKMVDALHAWKALNRTIVPRNVFQAECLVCLVKVLAAKVFWIGHNSVGDLRVRFFVEVCRSRKWKSNGPHGEPDPTVGQQQGENNFLPWSLETDDSHEREAVDYFETLLKGFKEVHFETAPWTAQPAPRNPF